MERRLAALAVPAAADPADGRDGGAADRATRMVAVLNRAGAAMDAIEARLVAATDMRESEARTVAGDPVGEAIATAGGSARP